MPKRLKVNNRFGSYDVVFSTNRPEASSRFRVRKGFPKIPPELFGRVLTLFEHYALSNSPLEVSAVLTIDLTTFRRWRVLIPEQSVRDVHVSAELTRLRDIETGEYHDYVPDNQAHVGSVHSHNRMDAFFSAEDDRSDVNVPGLHIVCGHITSSGCVVLASFVHQEYRFFVPVHEVIEFPFQRAPFHPDVLSMIATPNETRQNHHFP